MIFGAEAGSDLASHLAFRALWRKHVGDLPPELAELLPALTEDSFPGLLANVIAGRIANRLDLGGINFTVDAACAASLAAVSLGVKELNSGSSDLVLCGGADLHNDIIDFLMFSTVHALSPSGQCRTFAEDADGIVLGEGVAAVVLKRLEDAERDGDRIYAVIKGVGSSSDGRSLGLTAPRREGQLRALERAYEQAGISPAEVGLVEAHGTGTVVGDRTELETLDDVFVRAGAGTQQCALGSVKSQIGHTKCAAGLAGLIKATLALERGALPPTSNMAHPNPGWKDGRSPFTLSDRARPWLTENRVAGVSAFGFGGTNFHIALQSHAPANGVASGHDLWPSELFLFRGADRAAASARIEIVAGLLDHGPWRLRDLARSASAGDAPVQVAIVASDLDDLATKLQAAREGTAADGVYLRDATADEAPTVAFLFPGQGSQRVGMLGDLFVAFPSLRRLLGLRAGLADAMLPPTAWTPEARAAQQAALTDTRVAQPALGVAGLALASLLRELGVEPAMTAGHSYGELVALAAAGAFGEDALLSLSDARAAAMVHAVEANDGGDPGAMAAVSAGHADVAEAIAGLDGLVIANDNAPDQVVVSGTSAAVAEALTRFRDAAMSARQLPVACAFHSPLVTAAADHFAATLAELEPAAPQLPVYANESASAYPTAPDGIRALLIAQIGSPVRFVEEIEAMYEAGAHVFVEAGPGRVLTGLVGRILGERPHVAVACDEPGEHGVTRLLHTLGRLAAAGVPVDVEPLFAARDAEAFDLTAPPDRTPSPTTWLIDGHRALPLHGEVPAHALKLTDGPVVRSLLPGAVQGAVPGADRESVVLEYLQSVRELVATQREVLLGYLGAGAPAGMELPPVAVTPAPAPSSPTAASVAAAAAAAAGNGAPPASVLETLLQIVSERTGYPPDMLGLDLDLEADLSIDSIKRVEILGALDERLGGVGRDEVPEELVAVKTLRGILEVIERSAGEPSAPVADEHAAPSPGIPAEALGAEDAQPVNGKIDRYVLRLEPVGPAEGELSIDGTRIAVVPDGLGVADRLAGRLEALGATVELIGDGGDWSAVQCLVDLSLLEPAVGPEDMGSVFARVRDAVVGGTGTILVATALGGAFGHGRPEGEPPPATGGAAGLLRSLTKERDSLRVKAVDLDPKRDPDELCAAVIEELLTTDEVHEVGYENGTRHVLRVVPMERNGSGALRPLDAQSVVVVTGGARGIAARVTESLAARFGCRLELLGRTPLTEEIDDSELAEARDAVSIRKVLVARGQSVSEIEPACARILAVREIRSTLVAVQATGAQVDYHQVDVTDDEAFGSLIDELYERHGRIDGVIHGAGLIEDRLIADKTDASFERVFATKVSAANTLARKLRPDVRFVVFFSSVSGVFGNRGQSDYAAANDFLDKLAVALNDRLEGRVFSIDWGPWGGGGMVSPELAAEYAKRGIGLIEPEEGSVSFLDELLYGAKDEPQVILLRATRPRSHEFDGCRHRRDGVHLPRSPRPRDLLA